jgi:NADP-dependent aldehyde dehydrogenase
VSSKVINGRNIIGSDLSAGGKATFEAFNPRQGSTTGNTFHEATDEEIGKAAELSARAAERLQELGAGETADFLETIAAEILGLGDELIEKANEETALGVERLRGERDRTTNQLKLFAQIVREGSWVDARIDTPQPERKPVPKPDLRRILQPVGPVAVFGASNFPLAFSVAGGDTASALAARNPVIVKAHPAHPGTSELAGSAIARAATKLSLPNGTFSLVHGFNPKVSLALVTNEHVKAVAFTGSLRAGRALFDAAAKRPEPIPVFSEMGSVNPVFLLKSALDQNAEGTAAGFFRSVTLGVGQFCTCPGLAFGVRGAGVTSFVDHLSKQFEAGAPGTMLTAGIAKVYAESFAKAAKIPGVEARVAGSQADSQRSEGRPGFFVTDAKTWLQNRELREEMFGPSTVIVGCASEAEMVECARSLEGSLTATIHGGPAELAQQHELLGILQRKAGRLLFNGYPTGVELGYAMQHGGPYPASTDSRFTSVGTAAIYRFARPVCYQNFPDEALPEELRNANPRRIWRMIDGRLTKDPLG